MFNVIVYFGSPLRPRRPPCRPPPLLREEAQNKERAALARQRGGHQRGSKPGFGGFWWVLAGSGGLWRALAGFGGFNPVLSGFIRFCRVLVGFIGFYAAIFFCGLRAD